MKFTLVFLSLACCSCIAAEEKQQPQKRSVGLYDGIIGGSYGLPVESSISSHTHTHTTSVIEKPVIVSSPTITTTKIISPAVTSPIISSSYPSSFGSYGWPYSYGYPSTFGKTYSSYGWPSTYSNYGKSYSSFGWPSTYTKSYYSSPIIKSYRW